ncbi:MAG TPA: serine/threonine-protein kinase [Polyangiaceae bacterium]|nr:serine/threonine-protein kinase [Polyangiaceae bacterium]
MQTLGEYRIIRQVGEGGMGKVFEAEERLSGRRVALKVLRPELSRSDAGRRLFANEMAILAGLDHPNVVRCLCCTEVDGELVMALELLEGRTLREVAAAEGALDWVRAVGLVQQMARALSAAHEHEPAIVHRDLKPENVMILAGGSVKVMDFGVAKMLAALGNASTHSVGTLAYMSPEQIDAGPVDARSDLYALGLVFYELLAGRPPFQSSSPRELLNLQCTAAPPPLPDGVRRGLPRGVERLLFALLEKRPEKRPGSAADVLHELEPFGPSDLAFETPPSRRSRRDTDPAPPPAPEPSAPEASAPEPASAGPAVASTPSRAGLRDAPARSKLLDTLALIEQATAPREVSWRAALVLVLSLSALSGIATYAMRTGSHPEPTRAASRVSP